MGRPSNEELARRREAEATAPNNVEPGTPLTVTANDSEAFEYQATDRPVDAPLDLNEEIDRIRALREAQPFGAFDRKLAFPPIEGYKQHWFNDKPGRVDIAIRAGWTYVLDADGKPKTIIVDSGGLRGYLLKIPQQFWEEDQARQNAKATAALAAVKKKPDALAGAPVQASDRGAFYTPEGRPDAASINRA